MDSSQIIDNFHSSSPEYRMKSGQGLPLIRGDGEGLCEGILGGKGATIRMLSEQIKKRKKGT